MIRILVAAGLVALVAGAVLAQNLDVIKERQETMKRAGQATGDLDKMRKGQTPYDQAKVTAALQTYIDVAKKMPTLFPDDSKTGGNTEALPLIWTHKDDFVARYGKLGSDAAAAMTSVKDVDTLNAAFSTIVKNCGGCHETYRMKKG
jgi:cytochrome c556